MIIDIIIFFMFIIISNLWILPIFKKWNRSSVPKALPVTWEVVYHLIILPSSYLSCQTHLSQTSLCVNLIINLMSTKSIRTLFASCWSPTTTKSSFTTNTIVPSKKRKGVQMRLSLCVPTRCTLSCLPSHPPWSWKSLQCNNVCPYPSLVTCATFNIKSTKRGGMDLWVLILFIFVIRIIFFVLITRHQCTLSW